MVLNPFTFKTFGLSISSEPFSDGQEMKCGRGSFAPLVHGVRVGALDCLLATFDRHDAVADADPLQSELHQSMCAFVANKIIVRSFSAHHAAKGDETVELAGYGGNADRGRDFECSGYLYAGMFDASSFECRFGAIDKHCRNVGQEWRGHDENTSLGAKLRERQFSGTSGGQRCFPIGTVPSTDRPYPSRPMIFGLGELVTRIMRLTPSDPRICAPIPYCRRVCGDAPLPKFNFI